MYVQDATLQHYLVAGGSGAPTRTSTSQGSLRALHGTLTSPPSHVTVLISIVQVGTVSEDHAQQDIDDAIAIG